MIPARDVDAKFKGIVVVEVGPKRDVFRVLIQQQLLIEHKGGACHPLQGTVQGAAGIGVDHQGC
jgi:hypothetical protein